MGLLPKYRSPMGQILIISFVCFFCPGMFNALNGMGGAGQVDTTVGAQANVALYACFAIGGLLAGGVVNVIGTRFALVAGGVSYIVYSASLLVYNHTQNSTFVIFSGGLLGCGAALLWTAQGMIMMAYPTDDKRGQYIAIFWCIFNLGGVIGGLIPFIANFDNPDAGSVSDGTYIAFLVMMSCGAALGFTLADKETIVKDDGSKIETEKNPSFVAEVRGLLGVFKDKRMLLITPAIIASNWFYTYHFNGVNAHLFNVRTRGLNNVCYWGSQMVAAYILGTFMDNHSMGRKKRAVGSLLIVAVFFTFAWILGLVLQLQYPDDDVSYGIDFTDSAYIFPIIVYILYGMGDAMIQAWCYWIMGSFTEDSSTLARFAGYYKGVQSAGAACAWAIDAEGVAYLIQLILSWALFTVSIPPAYLAAKTVEDADGPRKSVIPINTPSFGYTTP